MKADKRIVHTPKGDMDLTTLLQGILYCRSNPRYEELSKRYALTELGAGYLFADCFKDVLRFVPERGKWFRFDKIWDADKGKVMEDCKELGCELIEYAIRSDDESIRSFANKWQYRRMRETILKEAASVHTICMSEFDKDPYILNCQNGTLDLQTMTFHDHNPNDLLTKITGAAYDPNARCPRWEEHIRVVMQDDMEKALYLQKALGYALTGSVEHDCMFILHGRLTRNGKGTTMETTNRLLGTYARSCAPSTIAQKNLVNSRGPSEDIASLAGARFINISEPDKNMVLDAALVKSLTGKDKIVARFLHENSFTFYMQGKLFINANYLPQISDTTVFSSGRIKVISFDRYFEEHERDLNLANELAKPESLSGILNWFVEGWQLLNQQGFNVPQSVKDATEQYMQDSDRIGLFLDEVMVKDENALTPTTDAYGEYTHWCYENGYKVENMSLFKKSMGHRAEIKRKRPGGLGRSEHPVWCICGYKLRVPVNVPVGSPVAPDGAQEAEGGTCHA